MPDAVVNTWSPPSNVFSIVLTLEEIHTLGKVLDLLPFQQDDIEDVIEGIYDKIDPILSEAFGYNWSDQ